MTIVSNSAWYRIEIWSRNATTYAKESRVLNLTSPKNLGWSDYVNDVPEAFFSMDQDDPKVAVIKPYLGKGHMLIYRHDIGGLNELVWGGWLGGEVDSQRGDVIIYGHGYLSSLFYLHTDWEQKWETEHIGDIVIDLWNRAKTGIAGSELSWAVASVIQAPATTSGGATPIILPLFQTYYKRILFCLRDLSDIGRSDTTNGVVFRIDPSGNFYFYGNKGADRDVVYQYGTRNLNDFQIVSTQIDRRNEVLAVGMSPRDLVLRSTQSHSAGQFGRRQEALLLQWVRDQTELDRVTRLRLKKANREYLEMRLSFLPGSVIPINSSLSPFELADRIRIKINKGTVDVDRLMLVSGIQVLYLDGLEHVRLMVEDV